MKIQTPGPYQTSLTKTTTPYDYISDSNGLFEELNAEYSHQSLVLPGSIEITLNKDLLS